MKKILFIVPLLLVWQFSEAQTECATNPTAKPIIYTKKKIDSLNSITAVNIPYAVKVHITVFSDNDGQNRADNDANILTNFQYMVNTFQPHNICFILVGLKQVNNTDLNYHDTSNEPTSELDPFKMSGCLNIFIHRSLFDNSGGYNGQAYSIPNTFLSLSGVNYNIATMGHEMGHCLGLYHTFRNIGENGGINENVARTGNCKNCETAGDYLCDTPADDDGGVNVNCNYVGTGRDACSNAAYSPLTNNMMGYGNFLCRNSFTTGQGQVMRATIIDNSTINALVANDILNMPFLFNLTISTGTGNFAARDALIVSDGAADLTINGSAIYTLVSKKVTLKSGTRLEPSLLGKVNVKSSAYCN